MCNSWEHKFNGNRKYLKYNEIVVKKSISLELYWFSDARENYPVNII